MSEEYKRYYVRIYGVVQGIGYRPYIYKVAKQLKLNGWVNNIDSSVVIDIGGRREKVNDFLIKVIKRPPKLARIQKVEIEEKDYKEYKGFTIKESISEESKLKFIIPDIATCNKCIEDIFNINSKRYRYAFTNCTDCGPRYSIIEALPYDRSNTTMKQFQMCSSCYEEYVNPETRRFHAQPNCCEKCGPKLILTDNNGREIKCNDEIKETAKLLKMGKIFAIKGIGGFHIVCDGNNSEAVEKIRIRKKRPHKPLAIMTKNMEMAKKVCSMSQKEEEILISNKRPIVLLNKKYNELLPQNIAPKVKKYGIMLPYTPLHYLLFNEGLEILVMTSGNISGCPIEYKNDSAIEKLKGVVDYFLLNNREIYTPVDDSVVRVINGQEVVSRLGRGYTPLFFNEDIKNKIFSCGSEMKNTFAFSVDGIVYVSQYLGDLKNLNSFNEYKKSIKSLTTIFKFKPEVFSYDMHPLYMCNLYAKRKKGTKIKVQHHHSHMASCMMENNINEDVIGIIYDGMGLGMDNNIWGGEFLIGNRKDFKRAGSFRYTTIQGGDSAQRDIWKVAVSYINSIENLKLREKGINLIKNLYKQDVKIICKALERNINCYKTSSVGRLFDGVAAILGVRGSISYEGQGAIELEAIADNNIFDSYKYSISEEEIFIVNYIKIIEGILRDIEKGIPSSVISTKFHNTVVKITVHMTFILKEKYKLNKVVISGGVFENEYLITRLLKELSTRGFEVFFNKIVPTNDGGISFGQIAVADEILKREC